MTFLNPLILWALLTVSIPILIHIFNLRKTRRIEFSTLMFLKEIQQTKYRKIKLKQILILICRIAFISLLVMAFANPYQEGYIGASGDKPQSSVLIILDDSFSMEGLEKEGRRLEIGLKKIKELLQILNDNDEIYFTTISSLPYAGKLKPYSKSELLDSLNNIKSSRISRNIDEVIHYSSAILNSASRDIREIFLFTDLQKHFFHPSGVLKGKVLPEGTIFNLINLAERNSNNISADTIEVISKIPEKSRPVKIKLTVNNRNNFNVNSVTVILKCGNFTQEKAIDISSNSTVDLIFEMPVEKSSYVSGYAEITSTDISQDEIASDNKQYFTIFVPDRIEVLTIGEQSDLQYINFATDAAQEIMKSFTENNEEYFNIKNSVSSLNSPLSDYNAIIIVNKKSFTEEEAAKIREYLESGGGVIIYPGSSISEENYNNTLFPALDLGNGFAVTDNNPPVKFEKIDLQHPLFEDVFIKDRSFTLESPEINRLFQLPRETELPSVTPVFLTNGEAFLKEYNYTKGKLILFSVSPDIKGSDYASRNIFAPLSVRTILYAASVNQPATAIAGRDYLIDLDFKDLADSVVLIAPDATYTLPAKKSSFLKINRQITDVSVYSLYSSGKLLYQFPATFDKHESEDLRFTPEEIQQIFTEYFKTDINYFTGSENLSASVTDSRTGRSLWKYFLAASLLFLLAEYLISRYTLKSKHTQN
ncbi:MAG: BatA and WFA domain-containing protein [Ignavibacteria bacterium]|nr:BatA and WFA domain-containing protein [Ignavibacteria bacterium]